MEFVPLLVMTALVKKLVDFAKYGTSGDVNALVTQVVAWAAGVAAAFVTANSDWGDTIIVNGDPLALLNGWSLALMGVNIASLAGVGWDAIKAVDASNSAVVPTLLNHPPHPTPPAHTTAP